MISKWTIGQHYKGRLEWDCPHAVGGGNEREELEEHLVSNRYWIMSRHTFEQHYRGSSICLRAVEVLPLHVSLKKE